MSPRRVGGRYGAGAGGPVVVGGPVVLSPVVVSGPAVLGQGISAFTGLDSPPPGDVGHGGNVGPSTTVERSFSGTTTALGSVSPVVYGTRRVSGVAGLQFFDNTNGLLYLGMWICQKEVAAINGAWINSDPIATVSYLTYYNIASYLGSLSQGLDGFLSAGAGLAQKWPGRVWIPLIIDLSDTSAPGGASIVAEVQGTKIAPIGGGAKAYSENPVEIVYDILTDANEPWLDIPTAEIDTTSWQDVADWCDDVMADSTVRWTYNGVIYERDPWAAALQVLRHCHAYIVPYRDKLYMWSEQPRTASGVHIGADNWVKRPGVVEVPRSTIAEVVRVRYYDGAAFDQAHVDAPATAGSTLLRMVEANLDGCDNPSMAYRWGCVEHARATYQRIIWEGIADRTAADLLPGDVFTFSPLDGVANQTVRLHRITDLPEGAYHLRFSLYYDLEDEAKETAEEDAYPDRRISEEG